MDILFTHSYFLRFDPKELKAMMPYPPLGTLYAAAVARQKGYHVGVFDSMLANSEEDILPLLRQHAPKVLVIYDDDFNYLTKMCLTRMRNASFTLAAFGKEHGCTVIAHGSDPVDHVDEYLSHGADFVICGEGEITLSDIFDHLFQKRGEPLDISGIALRQNGRTVRTATRQPVRDLDAFPFPSRDLVNMRAYRDIWKRHHGFFSLNMVTTRGCPYHCNWCAKPLYGQVYNSRSPANVVDEMNHLKEFYEPDHLWFCDDIFGLLPGWVAEFAEVVLRNNAVIPFKCLARVDLLLKHNTIADLKRSGCTAVWVGAESGSQKILDAMEKGITVEQIREATRRLKQSGIRVGFFLQYGYTDETLSDIEATLDMISECKPDDIGVSVSYPLPGTRFYESVKHTLGEKKNWVNSSDLDPMLSGSFTPEFYKILHTVTHKKFRFWQGLDRLQSVIRSPLHIRRDDVRRLAAGAFHGMTLPRWQKKLSLLERK